LIYQNVALAQNLQKHLRNRNISQTSLINKIGMSHTTLHGYLYGITPQGLNNLIKLADYFNIGLDDLIFNQEGGSHA
jgi:transcriptional regulator with XRE-family HTH domain